MEYRYPILHHRRRKIWSWFHNDAVSHFEIQPSSIPDFTSPLLWVAESINIAVEADGKIPLDRHVDENGDLIQYDRKFYTGVMHPKFLNIRGGVLKIVISVLVNGTPHIWYINRGGLSGDAVTNRHQPTKLGTKLVLHGISLFEGCAKPSFILILYKSESRQSLMDLVDWLSKCSLAHGQVDFVSTALPPLLLLPLVN